MDLETRRQAVSDLVLLRKTVPDAITEMRKYPWDCDEELITLGPTELRTAIEKFLAGALSAQELEDWANAVEGRDDIDFAPEKMTDLVAEIANPMLFEPITPESMKKLADRLSSLGPDD
ncbi:hypothetical protein [Saccharopolyspora sp. ASAGF58]|uniref:hypothetical protein n=1 Tax=Saccharopolyspora TaxID=1835 RepID=UPI00143FCA31|nr:hypothetical protein [Saccharopolyspora sp. ASAGF58]QIZ36213.1 hypothetical protein FDZ84_17910 [Saccharopolyspora sp. ASAGF58]